MPHLLNVAAGSCVDCPSNEVLKHRFEFAKNEPGKGCLDGLRAAFSHASAGAAPQEEGAFSEGGQKIGPAFRQADPQMLA